MAELWDIFDKKGNKTKRLHERGKPMQAGDYRLVVRVCIMNSNDEMLIQKGSSHIWGFAGGAAISGEDGLQTALREAQEELGISLAPQNGRLFKRYCEPRFSHGGGAWVEVWLFKQEVNISDIIICKGETLDAKWVSKAQIQQMISNGSFTQATDALYPFLDELLELSPVTT